MRILRLKRGLRNLPKFRAYSRKMKFEIETNIWFTVGIINLVRLPLTGCPAVMARYIWGCHKWDKNVLVASRGHRKQDAVKYLNDVRLLSSKNWSGHDVNTGETKEQWLTTIFIWLTKVTFFDMFKNPRLNQEYRGPFTSHHQYWCTKYQRQ